MHTNDEREHDVKEDSVLENGAAGGEVFEKHPDELRRREKTEREVIRGRKDEEGVLCRACGRKLLLDVKEKSRAMTRQNSQRVNLSPHYFYNFGIYRRVTPTTPRESGSTPVKEMQRGILHLDVSENTIEFVVKEDLQDKMHMNRIASTSTSRVGSEAAASDAGNGSADAEGIPDNMLTIVDTHNNTQKVIFCSTDDLQLFVEVLGQIKANSFNCLITQPRFVFKKGCISKVCSSGELRQRFAVLIAKKLFIFIDSTSYFPSNILYLDAFSIQYDGNTCVALNSVDRGSKDDVNAYNRGRRGQGKTHSFTFENGAMASSWASALEDAKDYVPSTTIPDDEVNETEETEEEGVFAEDIFHKPSAADDDNGEHDNDAPTGMDEQGFDEKVTKKQAFAFWGVESSAG